jgi:hypothetical protein
MKKNIPIIYIAENKPVFSRTNLSYGCYCFQENISFFS